MREVQTVASHRLSPVLLRLFQLQIACALSPLTYFLVREDKISIMIINIYDQSVHNYTIKNVYIKLNVDIIHSLH